MLRVFLPFFWVFYLSTWLLRNRFYEAVSLITHRLSCLLTNSKSHWWLYNFLPSAPLDAWGGGCFVLGLGFPQCIGFRFYNNALETTCFYVVMSSVVVTLCFWMHVSCIYFLDNIAFFHGFLLYFFIRCISPKVIALIGWRQAELGGWDPSSEAR